MSDKSGFTLVEAIVTVFIITVALWGTVTGLLKINSWVEDIENIAIVDKYIAGEMEEIRSTDYVSISKEEGEDIPGVIVGGATITMSTKILNEPEGPDESPSVFIQVKDESGSITIEIENTKKIEISTDNLTSHASPGKGITRAITFYVYKKGINYWQP